MKAAAERAVERLHLKMAVKDFEGARAAWKIAARAGVPPSVSLLSLLALRVQKYKY